MSGMLMNERFVAVFPSLVRLLGNIESAAIVQHLHFSRDEDGTTKITRQQISEETGIAFATVTRRLSWLRDEGWITSERASRSDSTQVYRVCVERIQGADSRESQSAIPEGDEVAGSESRNLQLSSLQKERTTTPVGREPSPALDQTTAPSRHPSRQMTADWQPRPEFLDYLAETYSFVNDLATSVTRFRNFHFAKQSTSKSWEALLDMWVSNDNERAEATILAGTDDLGAPLKQRKTSVVPDAPQPGDPNYFDAVAYLEQQQSEG